MVITPAKSGEPKPASQAAATAGERKTKKPHTRTETGTDSSSEDESGEQDSALAALTRRKSLHGKAAAVKDFLSSKADNLYVSAQKYMPSGSGAVVKGLGDTAKVGVNFLRNSAQAQVRANLKVKKSTPFCGFDLDLQRRYHNS
jgi:hypothetical protein